MKLYIYDIETRRVIEVIEGDTNAQCEAKADAANYDTDTYAWTYSPAFGTQRGPS